MFRKEILYCGALRNRYLPGGVIIMFSAILVMVSVSGSWAESKAVFLSAQRTESKLIEVAVPKFLFSGNDMENFGERASRIINKDLRFTGYFKPNENYDFMQQAVMRDMRRGKVNFEEWRTLSSNFLIKGSMSFKKNDAITVDIVVYDLQTTKVFFSKKYSGPRSIFRQIIHQFSDDFFLRVSGERGVARSKIAFISKVSGRKELFVMDYDGSNPWAVTSDRSLTLLPDWSPTNNMILFTTYRYRNPDLYAIDLRSKTRFPISRRIGLNSSGAWSPNGKNIAFSMSRRGNMEIYVSDANGSNLRRLTHSRAIETSPTWSPDGKRIAYTSDRAGSPQIYVMNVDGTGKRRITYKGGYNDGADWSPRGDTLAYASLLGGSFNIALVDINDKNVTQLTFDSSANDSPSWSPFGRHITFSSSRSGLRHVYIMNSLGANQTRISFGSGGGYSPTWGPVLR